MTPFPPLQQTLRVSLDYPVLFTENLFDPGNPLLARTLDRLEENRVHRAMVFVDSNLAEVLPQLPQTIVQYFEAFSDDLELAEEPRVIPGGEILKNDMEVVEPVAHALIEAHLCRHSYAVIVGGGAVLDTVGFAAALTHRGLRTVRVPTTLCAQINAGIGIKTGINFDGRKNGIGSFAPPFAVVNDHQFLYSLPERDWAGGLAEAFRLGLMLDGPFFEELCQNAECFTQRRPEEIAPLVHRAATLCLRRMAEEADPFGLKGGSVLDFGHWASHKLEMLSQGEISHAEAGGMGVLIDSRYAVEQGWLPEAAFERLYQAFTQLGLPLWFNELDLAGPDGNPEVFYGLPDFQEHKGGTLAVPFPDGVGSFRLANEVDLAVMEQALARLKAMAAAAV